jgi:hypothetical protein
LSDDGAGEGDRTEYVEARVEDRVGARRNVDNGVGSLYNADSRLGVGSGPVLRRAIVRLGDGSLGHSSVRRW